MIKTAIRVFLCSSLLLGAASAQTFRSPTRTTADRSAERMARPVRPPRPTPAPGTSVNVRIDCENGLCRVYNNGDLLGIYRGDNSSVETVSVNGVSVTQIYIDGQLVKQF
ncbi:hypothetical protein [Deinococcus koreensis]|uniref:MSHA biogenesis protein MshK n=1 Tax=Deinococcus koreensis TaxID=2054903 RepID=A0A2K3USY0_9DEIO|nr:hypothetical protein [Deinococcus koreensis]PNY79646.1 hypothetical protein CVO96_16915 [Deinococcus koreensis]